MRMVTQDDVGRTFTMLMEFLSRMRGVVDGMGRGPQPDHQELAGAGRHEHPFVAMHMDTWRCVHAILRDMAKVAGLEIGVRRRYDLGKERVVVVFSRTKPDATQLDAALTLEAFDEDAARVRLHAQNGRRRGNGQRRKSNGHSQRRYHSRRSTR